MIRTLFDIEGYVKYIPPLNNYNERYFLEATLAQLWFHLFLNVLIGNLCSLSRDSKTIGKFIIPLRYIIKLEQKVSKHFFHVFESAVLHLYQIQWGSYIYSLSIDRVG